MSDPKVSVIVPVYNAEKYIANCIEHLIHQTLGDIEIILINDGSTDNSLEIMTEFANADSRITLFDQEDLGQGNAVNRGFDVARGEYVAECDADDYARYDMYEKLYEAAKADDCDVVRCSYMEYYKDGSVQPFRMIPERFCNKVYDVMNEDEETRRGIIWRSVLLMPAIAKRQFLIDNGLRYREHGIFEDTSLSFKIRTSAKRYKYIPDYLYYYCRDNAGSGSATIRDSYSICEQYEEILRWNEARHLGLEGVIAAARHYSYMWNLSRMDNEEDVFEFLLRAQQDYLKEDPKPEYFNSAADWELYNAIKYGSRVEIKEEQNNDTAGTEKG